MRLSRKLTLCALLLSFASAAVFWFVRPADPHDDPRFWVALFGFLWPLLLSPVSFLVSVVLVVFEREQRLAQRFLTLALAAVALALPYLPGVLINKPWLSPEQAIRDREPSVRARGAELLGWQPGPEAVQSLIVALKDPDTGVRWEAARALHSQGPDAAAAVPALLEALDDPESLVSSTAALALGRHPSAAPMAVPRLIAAMAKDVTTRYYAADALGAFGPQAEPAIPVLLQALDDENRVVRGNAARALGRIGAPARRAIPEIRRLADDRYGSVREAAREARAALGDQDVPTSASHDWPEQTFSPEAWHRTLDGERYVFYKDLVRRHLVAGAARADIIKKLGPADFSDRFSLTYFLKYASDDRYEPHDALWKLIVALDRQGRAESWFLRAG